MTVKCFEFNMFPVNTYVLSDETNEAVIIDAGCYYDDEQEMLKQYIERNGLTVKHLLNTHLHLDHIFGNAFVSRTYGVMPEASADDEFLLPKTKDYCRMFGIAMNEDVPALGKQLADGDEVCFGNTTLKVIQAPGHSPGSLVYYSEKDSCLFCGDVLFRGSIGRTDLDRGNYRQLIDSISNRLFTLPDETKVYTGHGEPTTIGNEKMNNPFFR